MVDELNPPSVKYPARVFFYAQDTDALITAGYDSLRIERRKAYDAAWIDVDADAGLLQLVSGRRNYTYLDPQSKIGYQYRAVLQNSADPGTPPDIAQSIQNAVDTAYESILSIKELKEIYFWGQDQGFITEKGDFQPDYTFAWSIRYGIGKVETKLGIKLLPQRIVETHDWEPEGGRGYIQLTLDEGPVLSVETLKLLLPGSDPYTYPADWLRLQKDQKLLSVVPASSSGVVSNVSPFRARYIPDALEVTYIAGFPLGSVDAVLKEVVGKEAAFEPLNVAGDLIGGAGVASTSLSLDGLSQSIATTNSSTNAGFGARLIQYEKELRETYKTLRNYYSGIRMTVG